MSIKQELREAITHLRTAGIDTAELDARLLMEAATGLSRTDLMLKADDVLSAEALARFQDMLAQRCAHVPVARILGEKEFWSLPFKLSPATLVPRPDSELVVEVTLRHCEARSNEAIQSQKDWIAASAQKKDGPPRNDDVSILDIGTGTGCLLLSLLHELPNASGIGVDLSIEALETAQWNAQNLGLSQRAHFIQSDLTEALQGQSFDIIISNPPYIPSADIESLAPDVREHDPLLALDGGASGLEVYERLIPQVYMLLKSNGLLVLEIGIHQARDVMALCAAAGFAQIEAHKDLAGIDRVISALRLSK